MKDLRIIFVISVLMALIGLFSRCFNGNSFNSSDPRGNQYAGVASCVSCHQSIYNSYAHSNHYRTSSAVSSEGLRKLIGPSKDRIYFTDSSYIRIEEDNGALFQTNFVGDKRALSGKFDIAFGSSEKAQTYGYWKENKLYQLPLTYYTSINSWANSPGFSPGHARFERIIGSRCFECHASFVNRSFEQTGSLTVSETLDRNSIVYGIDCERCHGPALRHVKFQQDNPTVKTGKYIVSIKALSRRRQLEICAVCHSGNDLTTQRSLFAFVPGDTLSNYYFPDPGSNAEEPDVHGKQLQLLQASMCFRKSDMTCTSCHSSHASGEDQTATIISKCIDCHKQPIHTIKLAGMNCIDCHMPLQTSKIIYFNNGGASKNIPYFVRTHKIGIYK